MLRKAGLSVWLCLFASPLVFAQATAGINGKVIDEAAAVLPGATVTVTNTSTGAVRTTVTNGEGLYTVPALTPGMYSVKAELQGFGAVERKDIELITGTTLSVDVQLKVAGVEENLTVTGQAPLVEVTQSTLSASIRQTEVVQLPMINRSMAALMNLLPGAREVGGVVSAHGNVQTYVSFSGGGGQNYNMLVDGIDNKEDHCGGAGIVYSLEGIQEFKTVSTGSAEYGKGSTTVLMATKSGTNEYRGTVSLYGRNEKMGKIDYFSKPENGGTGKPPVSRIQLGGSFGGPIVKDKAWFFGSMERAQQNFEVVRSARVRSELSLLQPLNIAVDATPTIPQPSRDLMTQLKVNFQLSRAHNLFVRYASEYGYTDNDFLGTGAAFLTYSNGVMDHNSQKLWNVSPGWTWVINPSTVNQLTGQFITWTHDQSYPVCPQPGPGACLYQRLTFPTVSVGPIHAFPKWYNFEDKYEFKDDFSKQVGRHALKVGVDYTTMPTYGGIFGGGSPGSLNFFDDPSTIMNNTNGRYPRGFQTPGIVRTITVYSDTIGDYGSDGNWSVGAYAQDDFKVMSKLTLNLGLRYDVYEFMNQPNLDQNRTYQILNALGNPFGELPQTDKNNFGPRIGFAWDLTGNGRNVVRGSYGLYFVQQIKNTYYQRNYIEKPVIFINQTFTNSAIGVGQLANFVYGVSPLPATPIAPTQFPAGQNTTGYWYDPNLQDAQTHKWHGGFSHIFPHETVVSADYTHVVLQNGWRNLDINPLLPDPNNPTGPRVRPLAAELQRVYGDPRLMGVVNIAASVNRGLYDELALHFERRFSQAASFQTNYTLAYARGMGGSTDGALRVGSPFPQTPSAAGGDIYAPWESGPTAFDERHRVTIAGVFNLPWGFDVSPSVTAASARPYDQFRGNNPSGDGSLQDKGSDGNPIGIRPARGQALFNANARVTKNFSFSSAQKLGIFVELYNLTNRANFGNVYGSQATSVATYNKPIGYLGGLGAVSTIPNAFQMQLGARLSF